MKSFFLFMICSLITCLGFSQTSELWGPSSKFSGGVFRTDTNVSKYDAVLNFETILGSSPRRGKFFVGNNGLLYGQVIDGLIELDPKTDQQRFLASFFTRQITGRDAEGGIIQASNGKFYGMTTRGGGGSRGTLFEYDLDSTTVTYKVGQRFNPLSFTKGDLVEASNGKLYGMSGGGGTNNRGFIFEYNLLLDTLINVHSFETLEGGFPEGSLLEVSNGKLYGMTRRGGSQDWGTIFEYNFITDSIQVLHHLDSANTGRYPLGSLMKASNGLLYGLVGRGGINDEGVIIELDVTTKSIRKVKDFDSAILGASPSGDLVEASNGRLYGLCANGGTGNRGTLFQIDLNNDNTLKLYDFSGNSGQYPLGTLAQAPNGYLYGMTSSGGAPNLGVVFKFNISTNEYQKLYGFGSYSDGYAPSSQMMQAQNGYLYGVTSLGGANGAGTIYRLNPHKSVGLPFYRDTSLKPVEFKKIHDFDSLNGLNAYGKLVEIKKGELLGSTPVGGVNEDGVIYTYNYLTEQYQKIYDFDENVIGRIPNGELLLANNGKVYGTTEKGGALNEGRIYEFDLGTKTAIAVAELDNVNGARFDYGLMQASDNHIYGLASNGGDFNEGTIVRYDLTQQTLSKVYSFNSSNGSKPSGVLLEASDGYLYGLTIEGGSSNDGTIFRLDISNDSVQRIHDFSLIEGQTPNGNLIEKDGKLYGTTQYGGTFQPIGSPRPGTIFEYDLSSSQFSKKIDIGFDVSEPRNGLTLVDTCHQAFVSGIEQLIQPVCRNEPFTIQLKKQSALNETQQWEWSDNPSFLSPILSSSDSLQLLADSNKTMYVRATGGCLLNAMVLDSIEIFVQEIDTSLSVMRPNLLSNDSLASYRWLSCDSNYKAIIGETNRLFEPKKNGFYAVEVTRNSCVDTSYCKEIVWVGIEEITFQQKISLSPNPTSGSILMQLERTYQKIDIRVRNLQGQLIQEDQFRSTRNLELDIQAKAGVYFVELLNEKGEKANLKVVKQ